jgi:hypothetical protein
MRCSAWTQVNHAMSALVPRGGDQCTRRATYIDKEGRGYCRQHAKEFATVMRKATNNIRAGLIPLADEEYGHDDKT